MPRRQQQPDRNTSPPLKLEMKTSSSGSGMSKYSPYISCSSIDDRLRHAAAIGWPGETVQTSSASAELRQASEQVVPISLMKILEKWRGVQHQQAHPAEHPPVHPVDHRVVDAGVGRVPPPGQDVGVVQHLVGQAVLRLVLGGGADLDRVAEQLARARGDRAVHALGIALGHAGPVALGVLVEVLAPDGDADR